ncbi:hypothetical protein FJU30_10650 [Affinibrenneria salicis]|uniref:Uncharacterized protein n=1 Tax=Affinibrenneria salicis TaxID=2590031 RepID=A0A5J5G1V0_9GAMM|nr:hypothetical protein [Affinibrenneria salicis]KAA9000667.1 hypothetical protein FJU30_10650 [Affinibrenneria salicis]
MYKIILMSVVLFISPALLAREMNIDYCSTTESWAIQRTIEELKTSNNDLDFKRITVEILNLSALKEDEKTIKVNGFGVLYAQTLKVIIPHLNNSQDKEVLLVTSIISDEECSISQPLITNITELRIGK